MSRTQLQTSIGGQRRRDRYARIILMVVTVGAMGRLCTHEFTRWDDPLTVHQNGWLQPPTFQTLAHYATTSAYGLYIPLTYAAWAALALTAHVPKDESGIALNPWQFHTANVVFHLLGVLVTYRILRLVKIDAFAATCGALLFGVHPIQVEAVAWVSGLKDVLSGLLALVALEQYILFAQSDVEAARGRYGVSTLAFILALLAKPSVMALPVAALAIDRWIIGRSWRKVLPGAMGWLVIAIPFAVIARRVQDASNTHIPALWLRPLIVFDSLAFYAGKLVWPLDLILDYGRSPAQVLRHGSVYWDWIVPVGLGILLVAGRRKRPLLLAAGVVFVAGCLPVLGFTPSMFQFYSTTADHYLYFSMLGPALAFAWVLSANDGRGVRLTACLLLALLGILTVHQGQYWRNSITLFSHEIEVNPTSFSGYVNLGETYAYQRDLPRAIEAFQHATAAIPDYSIAWRDLADALSEAGRNDEAIIASQRWIALQAQHSEPGPSWRHDNERVGQLLFGAGRYAEAVPYLSVAAQLDPGDQHAGDLLRRAKALAASTTRASASAP